MQQKMDTKYGWAVVLITSVGFAIIIGLARVSGFIFLSVIDKFQINRTQASIMFMTTRLVTFAITPIVTKLLEMYNYSTLICSGGFICFLSLLMCSFATEYWQLILAYGIVLGVGFQLVLAPSTLVISMYFKKRRTLALSIYFSLGGAGGLVIPFLFRFLLDEYEMTGSFLIYSALILHICPLAFLIRQPKLPVSEKLRKQRTFSESSDVEVCQSLNQVNGTTTTMNKCEKRNTKSSFNRLLSTVKHDMSIFKDPLFLLQLLSRTLSVILLMNFIQFIPDFIQRDLNVHTTKTDIAFMLSITSVGDVVARLLVGTIIVRFPWHKKYTYAVLSIVAGIVVMVFHLAQSYALLLFLHVVFGLMLGICMVLQFSLEADLMGPEKVALSHGFSQAISGTASVVALLIVGLLRDKTGSYTAGMNVMGVSGILAGAVWALEPCFTWIFPPRVQPQPSLENFPQGETFVENAL